MGTIIVSLILIVITVLVIAYIVKQKKKGNACIGCASAPKGGCPNAQKGGCGCGHTTESEEK